MSERLTAKELERDRQSSIIIAGLVAKAATAQEEAKRLRAAIKKHKKLGGYSGEPHDLELWEALK